jgi:hypothetical protein
VTGDIRTRRNIPSLSLFSINKAREDSNHFLVMVGEVMFLLGQTTTQTCSEWVKYTWSKESNKKKIKKKMYKNLVQRVKFAII